MLVIFLFSAAYKHSIGIIIAKTGTHIQLSHGVEIHRLGCSRYCRACSCRRLHLMEQTHERESVNCWLCGVLRQEPCCKRQYRSVLLAVEICNLGDMIIDIGMRKVALPMRGVTDSELPVAREPHPIQIVQIFKHIVHIL